MTIEEMREQKKRLHLTNRELASKAGLPLSTVAKVLSGITENPRRDTVMAIEKVLSSGKSRELYPATYRRDPYERPGRYTIEKYEAMPEERAELIDGILYDLASPTGRHQQTVMQIWKALDNCKEEHNMACLVQAAPFDVELLPGEATIVQPDVCVFCTDPAMGLRKRAVGSPDFVCEVLSPSSRFRDSHLKLYKYRKAGVKEVWLVSIDKGEVEAYCFAAGRDDPDTYTFSDRVPVWISEGRCEVDFSVISRRIAFGVDIEDA